MLPMRSRLISIAIHCIFLASMSQLIADQDVSVIVEGRARAPAVTIVAVEPRQCFDRLYTYRGEIAAREISEIHQLFSPLRLAATGNQESSCSSGAAMANLALLVVPEPSRFDANVSLRSRAWLKLMFLPSRYCGDGRRRLSSNQTMQLTATGEVLTFCDD
jgi:hypothetical protein